MTIQRTELVNIDKIEPKDTIVMSGLAYTVGKKDIRGDSFMGKTIFGNNFRDTNKMVERVLFMNWCEGQFVGYVTQR